MKATCYPVRILNYLLDQSFKDELEDFKNKKVVVCENCSKNYHNFLKIVTSQGPGTVIDFALQLVESLCGEETRSKVAKGLLYYQCLLYKIVLISLLESYMIETL